MLVEVYVQRFLIKISNKYFAVCFSYFENLLQRFGPTYSLP